MVISEKRSRCQQCGKEFQQIFKPEYDAYTSFNKCPECRLSNACGESYIKRATEMQQAIVHSNARIKLVMGGMRSGKTTTLIAIVENAMRELNSRGTQILIHVHNEKQARLMIRQLSQQLSKDILIGVNKTDFIISTTYGVIEVDTLSDFSSNDNFDIPEIERELMKFDVIAVDNSTSSSLFDTIVNMPCNDIVAVGHCPVDKNNAFYKAWCSAYFGDVADTKAFKIGAWDNPAMADKKDEHEPRLIKSMGLERYVRDYYATWI